MSDIKPAILLAEDNKANQIISKAMIETIDATIVIAENRLEVLQHLQEQALDLILMDCQMPEMNGFEAVEKIRALENKALAEITVVALTADAQSDTRDACLPNYFRSKACFGLQLDYAETTIEGHRVG